MASSILPELQWRGLVADMANRDELEKMLAPGAAPVTVYVGFDPTADSLHLGSLLPIVMLLAVTLPVLAMTLLLGGVSAGSICWHVGGTTDSFGPDLVAVTNGLALLPYANGVHYDSESQRRPLYQRLIGEGALPDGFATDDGAGLLYRSVTMVEAVSEMAGKGAYSVRRQGSQAVEERREVRLLPGSSR